MIHFKKIHIEDKEINMKKYIGLFVFVIALFMLGACSSTDNDNNSSSQEDTKTETADTITIEHELGSAEVNINPEKVVVFDFGMLDTLDYLGIDVAALPQMSVPAYLDKYTSDEYENVGSLKEPDFEKINNIDPDLIIISGRQADLYDELSKLGPVVYVGLDHSRYIESFKENTEMIGEIFEKETEVNDILAEIDEQIEQIKDSAAKNDKNALIVLANESKISAYGEGSRFGIIHDVFGIPAVDTNIEDSTHGMSVTFEYVVEQNPDMMYVIDRGAAIGEEATAKDIVENDLIAKTTAMENDDIYYLNPDVWYLSGGGIVSIQEMITEIAQSVQ